MRYVSVSRELFIYLLTSPVPPTAEQLPAYAGLLLCVFNHLTTVSILTLVAIYTFAISLGLVIGFTTD